MSDEEPTFVLRPRRVSPTDLRWAERADELEFETLDRMRRAGERWAATLGAILGLAGSVFIVKGRDDVAQLSPAWQAVVGGLLLAALLVAVLATLLAARAAQGTPRKIAWPTGGKLRAWERSEALLAQRCLRASRALALAAVVLVASAVGVTWFGSGEEEADGRTLLVLRSRGEPLCGTLLAQTADGIRLTRDGALPARLRAADIRAVLSVNRCPVSGKPR
jgi:uncharacterized integral membrane protein